MNVLVGRKAPFFKAKMVNPEGKICDFCLETTLDKASTKGVLLFFYPLDFTFVCPTELVELNKKISEFEDRGIVVASISVDSEYSHCAWRKTKITEGGIGEVAFKMISDLDHSISKAYDVLSANERVSLRASFYIDADGIVRHQSINDLPIGRNIDEILRVIDAFKFYEKKGEVCPVNWKSGDSGMEPTIRGVSDYMTSNYQGHDNQ